VNDRAFDPERTEPEWLSQVLRENGLLDRGSVTGVVTKSGPKSRSSIVRLILNYTEDAPTSAPRRIMLKLPAGMIVGSVDRESEFYTSVAPKMVNPPTIQCYGAGISGGKYYLLLEDLSDTHFAHPPAMIPPLRAQSDQIITALAQLHAAWWEHPSLGITIGNLPNPETARTLVNEAVSSFPGFADFLGDRLSAGRHALYAKIFDSFVDKLGERFATSRGFTLIHGDPHIGNFLYPIDEAKDTLRILDWKSWDVGPVTDDLAYMMALFWFPERRARLERPLLVYYHSLLLGCGVQNYTWDALWHDYRLSVIRYVLHPIWQWSTDHPIDIWWHHLERIMLAFIDLDCAELL
jgi:thiamine kinase-like enzyme